MLVSIQFFPNYRITMTAQVHRVNVSPSDFLKNDPLVWEISHDPRCIQVWTHPPLITSQTQECSYVQLQGGENARAHTHTHTHTNHCGDDWFEGFIPDFQSHEVGRKEGTVTVHTFKKDDIYFNSTWVTSPYVGGHGFHQEERSSVRTTIFFVEKN